MTFLPTVIEKTHKGERAYDLYSRLLEDRIIFVWEQVHPAMVNIIVAQLLFLEKQDPSKDITMYINTPWGDVYSGMAIYDTMQHIKCDVSTVAVWLAASMGSIFLVWGTKGKRFALPHSRIMIHQPLGWTKWQITDMQIAVEEWLELKKMLTDILATRSGQSYDFMYQNMERDTRLSPERALEFGIIDEIIYPHQLDDAHTPHRKKTEKKTKK